MHHGALGSFATIYAPDTATAAQWIARLRELPGIIESVTAEEILAAAQRYWDMDKLVITSAGKPLS